MTTYICPGCRDTFHDEDAFVCHCYWCPDFEVFEAAHPLETLTDTCRVPS